MKRLVIFDLDGTLTDTSKDICDNVNKTLVRYGYPTIGLGECISFVGNGARKLVERALKGARCDNFEEVLAYYNDSYNFCGSPETRVYDGVKEAMVELLKSGYMLAIVSNKPQAGTDEVVKKFFSDIDLSYVFGQRDGIGTKPDRACVDYVLSALGVRREEAVFVGDSEVDALTAINAGVDGVSVLWGYRGRSILEKVGAKNFAADPEELLRVIKGMR